MGPRITNPLFDEPILTQRIDNNKNEKEEDKEEEEEEEEEEKEKPPL